VCMAGRPYSNDEIQLLSRMRAEGFSIPVIATRLGRTPAGIQGALRARGWVDPARSQTMKSVEKFTAEQRTAFQDFLYSRRSGHTSSDIRDAWNRGAVIKGWPAVNSDRVFRYRRKLGVQPTKNEYVQFESYRRKQRVSQKARRADERRIRHEAFRSRRTKIYLSEARFLRRKCQVCLETWPLTEEFFHHAGCGGKYFLKTCRLCSHAVPTVTAEERQVQHMATYDRHVAVTQISHATCERDAFLREHRYFPTRRCARCKETWELLPARYPKYHGPDGELYRKTCRFCLRAAERTRDRADNGFAPCPTSGTKHSISNYWWNRIRCRL
jgi:hypothetical protein